MPRGVYKHKPLTQELKRRISEANMGRLVSEETRRKIGKANKGKLLGRKLSIETKRRMSEGGKESYRNGRVRPMLGKHWSKEVRKKLSESTKRYYREHPWVEEEHKKLRESTKGMIPWNKGKMGVQFHTEATRKKISKKLRGEKSRLWRGGITYLHQARKGNVEHRLWREKIFKRDDYTCQLCKDRGGSLQAHHILPYSDFPEFRLVIKNGITLCKKCHLSILRKEWFYAPKFLGV